MLRELQSAADAAEEAERDLVAAISEAQQLLAELDAQPEPDLSTAQGAVRALADHPHALARLATAAGAAVLEDEATPGASTIVGIQIAARRAEAAAAEAGRAASEASGSASAAAQDRAGAEGAASAAAGSAEAAAGDLADAKRAAGEASVSARHLKQSELASAASSTAAAASASASAASSTDAAASAAASAASAEKAERACLRLRTEDSAGVELVGATRTVGEVMTPPRVMR